MPPCVVQLKSQSNAPAPPAPNSTSCGTGRLWLKLLNRTATRAGPQPRAADNPFASQLSAGFISRMTLTLDQIVDGTRQLTPEVRAELVERILLAGHGGIEPKVDEGWKQVSRQRIAEIRSGKAQGVPVDVALAEVRKLAGL
jgi:hypothetical protein